MSFVTDPARVLVAGGGFAAAEVLLALRALADDRVSLTLLAPERRLAFRPAATAAPFLDQAVETYDLGALAAQIGASVRNDRVEAIAPRARRVRTASDAHLGTTPWSSPSAPARASPSRAP